MMSRDLRKEERWLLEDKYGGIASSEFERDRDRLAAGEPVAYVIGWQPFLGLTIHLDSKPLIPRPETEWWTEQLLFNVGTSDVPTLRILDLCAGSGAIGCAALARLPEAEVYFGEIEPAHEATIVKNIRENNLDAGRAHVRIGDLFEPFAGLTFDIVAANPPYLPTTRVLPESVARFEPEQAVFAGADGLALIRRIAHDLPVYLKPTGQAWIECDNASAEQARALFEEKGFHSEIRTDQYDKPRFLVVSFP